MTRAMTLATLSLASALLTPVLVVGAGAGAGGASATNPAGAGPASASAVVQTAQAAPASSLEATCSRRVKVIYAGYGEGQDARCAATAKR